MIAAISKDRWQHLWRPRLSLRALFAVIAVLALALGYHLQWIRQRHELLAKYRAAAASMWGQVEIERDDTSWRKPLGSATTAPGLLPLFGEQGVAELWLVSYLPDPTAGEDARLAAETERAFEHRRARQLFPEADVWINEIPRRPNERLGRALMYRYPQSRLSAN
ncbi:MAG: hypothetical protein AB7O59_01215 [Pirellulales bacterium]